VDADADAHLDAIAPRAATELALDCDGRLEGGGRLLEGGEELVGTSVDFAAARSLHGSVENGANALQQGAVSIAQLTEQDGRSFDVGHQQRDEPPGQAGGHLSPLRLQLAGDEPDRHDAVLPGRVQQPLPCSLARGLVLEGDLVEPGQRVPYVGLVVDRQPPAAGGVDVGERPVGETRALAGLQSRHGPSGSGILHGDVDMA
jgi:hypothetical protein